MTPLQAGSYPAVAPPAVALGAFFEPSAQASGDSQLLGRQVAQASTDFIVYVFGGIWILLLVDSLFKLIKNLWFCVDAPRDTSLQQASVVSGAAFGGVVANSLH